MHFSTRTVSIVIASVLAAGMIALALWFSNPLTTKTATAEGTQELLAAYAKRDTDADGLPDWQEALYDTDPQDPHSVSDELTDGEAVEQGLVEPKFESQEPEVIDPQSIPGTPPAPASLTEQFSRLFLERYLSASGGQPMTSQQQEALVVSLLSDFSAEASKQLESNYSLLSVSASADVSATAYAGRVEQVLWGSVPQGVDKPLLLLIQDYIERGDTRAGATVGRIGELYQQKVQALASVVAPSHLMGTHLALLRSYDTSSRALLSIANFADDPLPALGALSVLQPSAKESVAALSAIAAAVRSEGTPAAGTPGALLLGNTAALATP